MNDDFTLRSRVEIKMTDIVENSLFHSIFFDNIFTCYDLIVHLRERGFEARGTMCENRLKTLP